VYNLDSKFVNPSFRRFSWLILLFWW